MRFSNERTFGHAGFCQNASPTGYATGAGFRPHRPRCSAGRMMQVRFNGQLEAAATVPLYPAPAAIVESAPAEHQDDEKDDDESGCVHCGLIMSERCLF